MIDALARPSRTGAVLNISLLISLVTALVAASMAGGPVKPLAFATLGVAGVLVFGTSIVAWRTLLVATIFVILFVPIRRYALPGNLPFQLEAYRVLIAFVMAVWLTALLIDPRVRFRRSAIDAPLIAVFTVSALSVAVNVAAITADGLTSDATKQLTFLASFLALFFLLAGLMQGRVDVDFLLVLLVVGGCVVSAFSLVELRTGFNVFNHLDLAFPFLEQTQDTVVAARGGYVRVVASSQHPIALGAMFVLLIPLALYLYKSRGQRRWLLAATMLALGTMATGSRTAIIMLLATTLVYLILRTRETVRFWPAVIPLVIVIHFAMPGVMGSLYKSFFPHGGLIAEQADAGVGSSRVTSFGPALEQVGLHPILGSGFGARSFHGEEANSFIVDDQWLSTAMETGLAGLLAWLWLFVRFLRRSFGLARRDRGADGWFYTSISASVLAFAVGMLTYDAFSFIQSTLVLFVILGLGCARMNERRPPEQAGAA